MLDLEGVAGPADIAIAGDENALRGEIKRLEDIGVTDFNAAITPVPHSTLRNAPSVLSQHTVGSVR